MIPKDFILLSSAVWADGEVDVWKTSSNKRKFFFLSVRRSLDFSRMLSSSSLDKICSGLSTFVATRRIVGLSQLLKSFTFHHRNINHTLCDILPDNII